MTPTNNTLLSVLMAYHTQQIEAWDNRSPEFKHHFGKFCGWDIAGIEIDCGGYICETTFNEFTIPLRSVEQMTDEEYVEVARITGVTSAKGYRSPCGGEVTLRTIGWEILNRSHKEFSLNIAANIREYLISIGIAVPMHGMTVQDMIDNGLITIKDKV